MLAHDQEDLRRTSSYPCERVTRWQRKERMPVIVVNMWPGRDENAKRRIAEGITKVFEDEGVPRDVIEVIMNEVPKVNWAIGGKLHSD
jgi:4-oxalocrotonate tautomerase family enzyme